MDDSKPFMRRGRRDTASDLGTLARKKPEAFRERLIWSLVLDSPPGNPEGKSIIGSRPPGLGGINMAVAAMVADDEGTDDEGNA